MISATLKSKNPVIVSCTDGVGTKIDLANDLKFDTIGIDLSCVIMMQRLNCTRSQTLFRLHRCWKIKSKNDKKILKGIFKKELRIIKLTESIGGETAEMPGVYTKINLILQVLA